MQRAFQLSWKAVIAKMFPWVQGVVFWLTEKKQELRIIKYNSTVAGNIAKPCFMAPWSLWFPSCPCSGLSTLLLEEELG